MSGPSKKPGKGSTKSAQSTGNPSAPRDEFDDAVALSASSHSAVSQSAVSQSAGSAPSSDDVLHFGGTAAGPSFGPPADTDAASGAAPVDAGAGAAGVGAGSGAAGFAGGPGAATGGAVTGAAATGGPGARRPGTRPAPKQAFEARKVRLSVKRIDPWSVMKLGFLLSIAAGIMLVVATVVVWNLLDSMYVFAQVDELVVSIVGPESEFTVLNYVAYDMVTSYAVIIGVVNVVLITALTTIGAFLYNLTAMLIGGVNVTLTDE